MGHQAVLRLPAEPASVAYARHWVRDQVLRLGTPQPGGDLLDALVLVTSELAANAVVRSTADVELTLRVRPGEVEVAIGDTAPGVPVPAAATADAERGRGLILVTALARAWGVRRPDPGGGKQVWATLALPGP